MPHIDALNFLSAYPPWLLITVAVIVAIPLMWLMKKVMKIMFWLTLVAVVFVGIAYAIWLFTK